MTEHAWKIGVPLVCLWQARDLFDAWARSPFDGGGAVVAVLWCLPLLFARARRPTAWLHVGALMLTLAGTVLSLHVLHHAGLAVALAGWGRAGTARMWWLAGAPAWMPVLGWAGSRWFADDVLVVRFALVVAAVVPVLMLARRKELACH